MNDLFDIAAGELPPGDAITCGNRLYLPRKQRRHLEQNLGPDTRNGFARGFVTGEVFACQRCGRDRFVRYE
jgi:hypothetical protein